MNEADEDFLDLTHFYEGDGDSSWEERQDNGSSTPVERYRDAELIASGGMKDIFKVYDTKTCRHIAMAQLRKEVPEEQCESFLKEAYLTASMEHPNIISVYDVGTDEKHEPFFTMELKVGDTLRKIQEKSAVSLSELLEIFLKVCDAISYAHSCGILHLDIKPDNIQVGKFGEVQVCDWGLGSYLIDMSEGKDSSGGLIKGTPGYMSPEQGKPGEVIDNLTDIYSLGALLYSLLTGKNPVAGGYRTIISKTVSGKIDFPLERFPNKKIPESLDAVVRKAMSYEKKERYQSVDELKREVNQFLTGYSTQAENAGFLKELSLFYNRNRQICLVVIAAFVLIAAGSTVFFLTIQESKKQTENALQELQKSHSDLKDARHKEKMAYEKSEENFNKFIEQRDEKRIVSKELVSNEMQLANDKSLYPLFFADPVKEMNESIALLQAHYDQNGKLSIAQQLIKNLFIAQRFEEIPKYEAAHSKPLANLAKSFGNMKRMKGGELKDEDFLKVLKGLNSLPEEKREFRYSMVERMIRYQMQLKKSVFTSPEVLIQLLKCWNPKWDETQFKYDHKKRHLKVSGKNLRKTIATARHSAKSSFFRLIKCESLDVRGTDIQNMYQFIGLSLKFIDVRDTVIDSVTPHIAVKGIAKVVISPEQFSKSELRRAPKNLKISYK